jgi:hypothetical protein
MKECFTVRPHNLLLLPLGHPSNCSLLELLDWAALAWPHRRSTTGFCFKSTCPSEFIALPARCWLVFNLVIFCFDGIEVQRENGASLLLVVILFELGEKFSQLISKAIVLSKSFQTIDHGLLSLNCLLGILDGLGLQVLHGVVLDLLDPLGVLE